MPQNVVPRERGKKLSNAQLRAILNSERRDALSALWASRLTYERTRAMDYYLGDMSTDMPPPEGRSKAVSQDVMETIEGLMPTLMDIFCSGDEVVKFDPVGPEDVKAAEQETDYVNYIFMQCNPGFMVLYSFIKDALLSKAGIVKVFWDTNTEIERETYFDQPEDAYMVISSSPDVEVVEHSEHDGLHDVTIEIKKTYESAKVVGVPPEEFGIERNARNIAHCGYCFHEVIRREDELVAQGYDQDQVRLIPTYTGLTNTETIARDTIEERSGQGGDYANSATRRLKIIEHYIRLDYKGDGETQLYRVVTDTEQGNIMQRDGEDDITAWDMIPFAAMSPVPQPHRFFGRSIADLVMDIQRIKTALVRGMLDNLYLHNNPRVEVPDSHCSPETLDDLLISRPGGVVRTKQPGGLQWQEVPDITQSIYPALQYFDATREWRTGVSRQGQGVDPNSLQNQVATIASQMYNAAQAKSRLIARVFAETGIRDLFSLLHATIRKHASKPQQVRLRSDWVQVDPRDWKTRDDMSINVGLGTGSKNEQLQHIQLIIQAQTQAVMGGLPIVSAQNFFNSAKELTKLVGHRDVEQFFVPPGKPPDPQNPASAPLQKPPDPKAQAEAQKAQIEQQKVQADAAHQQMKTQADIQFQTQKAQIDTAAAQQKAQIDAALAAHKAQIDEQKAILEAEIRSREHHMDMAVQQAKMNAANTPKATVEVKHGANEITGPLGEAIGKFGEHMAATHKQLADTHAQHLEAMKELAKHMTAPRKIVRGADGKVSHSEVMVKH